jgi:hypothetical protein
MKLGILGTMVWDRIHARDGRSVPFEEWGGITYTLAAADACRPPGWTIVPILKIGADLEAQAYAFLSTLKNAELTAVRVVDSPNNRVELHYQDKERRCERLTGGVPGWTWDELAPQLEQVDALYINFISGFELELEEALRLRLGYHGPMYADLHSLMLGIDPSGLRTPRPLEHWRDWLRCFDVIQVNEEELASLAAAWGDPWRFAAEVVGDELKLLLITLGSRGAAYVASAAFKDDPFSWRPRGIVVPAVSPRAAAVSKRVEAVQLLDAGDPTGCGDVWGATCFCRLLAGDPLESALLAANRAAARNVQHRGATGLNHFLQGRIAS